MTFIPNIKPAKCEWVLAFVSSHYLAQQREHLAAAHII